jgi:arylsulfatase A-like enzyme
LPTIGELIGASLPELPIDGVDISPLLFAETSDVRTPRESFYYYYAGGELHAVRDREWKLVFPHQYRTMGEQRGGEKGRPVAYQQARAELALYHLKSDVQESRNVLAENPDVVQRLQALAAEARKSLGDKLTGDVGNALRQPGRVEAPKSVDN